SVAFLTVHSQREIDKACPRVSENAQCLCFEIVLLNRITKAIDPHPTRSSRVCRRRRIHLADLQIAVFKLVQDCIEIMRIRFCYILKVCVKKVLSKPIEPAQRPVFGTIELRAYPLLPVGVYVPN